MCLVGLGQHPDERGWVGYSGACISQDPVSANGKATLLPQLSTKRAIFPGWKNFQGYCCRLAVPSGTFSCLLLLSRWLSSSCPLEGSCISKYYAFIPGRMMRKRQKAHKAEFSSFHWDNNSFIFQIQPGDFYVALIGYKWVA